MQSFVLLSSATQNLALTTGQYAPHKEKAPENPIAQAGGG